MFEFSSSSQENEIHRVDGPFNEYYKNAIFPKDGWLENLGKVGNIRDIYHYANWGVVNFERQYWSLLPAIKIFVVPEVS